MTAEQIAKATGRLTVDIDPDDLIAAVSVANQARKDAATLGADPEWLAVAAVIRLVRDRDETRRQPHPSDTADDQPGGHMAPVVVHDAERGGKVRFTGRKLLDHPTGWGEEAVYLTGKQKIAVYDGDGTLAVYDTFEGFANDPDNREDDAFVAAVAAALGRHHVVDLDI